jgi:cytochrome c-type biogenesis protein CcmF
VLFGTFFPWISEAATGQEISVGPPFFQRVNFPIGLALLALAGIGPVIAWRRATKKNLQKNFSTPLVVGLVVAGALWVSGVRHGLALTTWGISAFVLTIIATEFWKATRARARIEGEGYVPALFHLVSRNRRRWGGYIVHVGMVMMFLAFAGAAYNVDERFHVQPGDVVEVASPMGHTYTLTYEGLSTARQNGLRNLLWQAIATVSVSKEGRPVGVLTTEKRQYTTQDPGSPPMTEVGIRSTLGEDLYLILSAVDDAEAVVMRGDSNAQGIDLQVLVKPLVNWIWLGCLTLVGGTIIALWPSVDRKRAEREGSAAPVAEGTPAGSAG